MDSLLQGFEKTSLDGSISSATSVANPIISDTPDDTIKSDIFGGMKWNTPTNTHIWSNQTWKSSELS
eukprot:NODE_4028_length_705_cov_71.809451_g3405_i0.p3 GENE.NODE_4028_length_705_cov_71.809451_g3405_i0~~NODE_4028_length_705_cov_71.809451_g3405_i0.p3  ORF type:complete len:67 (+),score=18.85 NODE_4028_length_705_cov_71.809451_g3405_i0:123-323(+)